MDEAEEKVVRDPEPPKGRWKRRGVRILLASALLLLVAVASAYVFRRPLFEAFLCRKAAEILRQEAGLDVSIGAVEGTYVTGLRLKDVSLRGLGHRLPQVQKIHVLRLDVDYDPLTLARKGLEGVHGIRAKGVTASIDLTAKREEAPPGGPAEPPPEPARDAVGDDAEEPAKLRPFHEIPLPPLIVEEGELRLRGKGFSLHGVDLDFTTGGTSGTDLDALLSWEKLLLEAGGRRLTGEPAFLRLSKRGPEVTLRVIEGAQGRWLGQASVRLPDRIEGGKITAKLRGGVEPIGNWEVFGHVALPPAEGFSVEGELSKIDVGALARLAGPLPATPHGRAVQIGFEWSAETWDLHDLEGQLDLRLEEAGLAGRVGFEHVTLRADLGKGLKGRLKAFASWGGKSMADVDVRGAPNGPCKVEVRAKTGDLGPFLPALKGYPVDATVRLEGDLTGDYPALQFQGRGGVSGANVLGVRDGDLHVTGVVNRAGFDLEKVTARAAGGRIDGWFRGVFPPGRSMAFHADLDVADAEAVVPPQVAESLRISGALKGKGEAAYRDEVWTVSCDLEAMGGAFLGYSADVVEVSVDLAEKSLEVMNLVVGDGERVLEVPYFEANFSPDGVKGVLPYAKLAVGREALYSRRPVAFTVGKETFRLSPMELRGDWARIHVAGELRRDGALSGMLVGDHILLERVDRLVEIPGDLSGSVSFDFEVEGTSRKPRLRGQVNARGLRYEKLGPVDAEFQGLTYRDGLLSLDDLEIRTDAGSIVSDRERKVVVPLPLDLEGKAADDSAFLDRFILSPDLDVKVRLRDLSLASLIGGEAGIGSKGMEGTVRLRGPLSSPGLEATLTCSSLEVKGVPPCSVALKVKGEGRAIQVREFEAVLPTGLLKLKKGKGKIPLAIGARRSVEGKWTFDPLDTKGTFDLLLKMKGFDLATFLETVKAPEQYRSLEGKGELELEVEGTWERPEIRLEGEVDEIRSPHLKSPGEFRFKAEYRDDAVEVQEFEVDLARGHVEGEGRIPIHLGLDALRGEVPVLEEGAEVEGEVDLRGIPLEPASSYVEGLKRSAGRIDGRGFFSGPVKKPLFRADLRLDDGALVFKDPTLPRLDSMAGRLDLVDRRLRFHIEGKTGGGTVGGRGTADLTREWNLESISMVLSGEDRPLLWTGDDLRARADFQLLLEGTPEEAKLTGNVDVFYTVVDLRHDLGERGTGKRRLVPGFRFPGLRRVDMDVNVGTPEGLRLKSEIHQRGFALAEIDVRLRAAVHLDGETSTPRLLGKVYTESGTVDLPFYKLTLVTGNLNFLETNPENPQLHFLARTVKGNTAIYVTVNGSLAQNDVRFFSEPPMEEQAIQAYLATGVRMEAWRKDQAGETLGVQIATLVAKQISPFIFGKGGGVGASLLDRVTLSSEKEEDTRFATYRAEFRLLDWLWLVGERNEHGHYEAGVKARVGFRSIKAPEKESALPAVATQAKEKAPLPFEVVFEGTGSLKDALMLETVEDDLRRYAEYERHPSYLEDAVSRLEVLYRKHGHHHVKAAASFRKSEASPAVVFTVDAGPWVQLKSVRFKPKDLHFKEKDLAPFFENEKRLLDEFGKRRFTLLEVKRGISRVERLYRNAGFLRAKVELNPETRKAGQPGITWKDEEKDLFRVHVRIDEGPRAFVKAVLFEGEDLPPREEILRHLGDPVGKPFSTSMPFLFRNQVVDFFSNRGYPFCSVKVVPEIDATETSVTVRVAVEERCELSRIGKVVPKGNRWTLDGVVRHVAGFSRGALFRGDEVRAATSRLMRSGLFRFVEIKPVTDPSNPRVVNLDVEVSEAKDFEVTAQVGGGEYEVFASEVTVHNRNILGTGRRAWIRGYVSAGNSPLLRQAFVDAFRRDDPNDPDDDRVVARPHHYTELRTVGFEGVIHDPWVFNFPLETKLRVYAGQRAETNFQIEKGGFEIPLTIPLLRDLRVRRSLRLRLAYEREFSRVFDVTPGIDPGQTDTDVSSVEISVTYDSRDSLFNPRWGYFAGLSYTYAGRELRGSLAFDRADLLVYAYFSPAGDLFTLAFGGSAVVIDPKLTAKESGEGEREKPIPLAKRLIRGGNSSVRSFWFEQLGPRENDGSPAGGEGYLQFNLELRVPVYKFMGVALFFEGGSLKRNADRWLKLGGHEIPRRERFRFAVGFGLRANTPIGPLRLDLAFNPDPWPDPEGEDPWALHFSVGHPF
ncbi:MAG: translocation/assembly module TamB domain-containing protein [Planctomycetota bacterium]|jgi:outer membrane protein insertion porin family